MRSLKASFLLIGNWDKDLEELGAHLAADLNQARQWLKESFYDVIALSITSILGKKFAEFYEEIKKVHPATQFIAVVPLDFPAERIAHLHEQFSFSRIITDTHEADIQEHLFAALEEANQRKQDENLALLISEQSEQLQRLQIDLEERVRKRTKFLTEARRKLFLTNSRIEGFKRALMAVHQANSVPEIEQYLNESLAASVQTSWIRIFFHPQDELFSKQVKAQLNFTELQIPLFRHHERVGSIFFLRQQGQAFNREEGDFLSRVAEAVALALDRIQKLKESESLKEQWETTFNSMSDPVVMIDENYDIIQWNQALNERFNKKTQPPQKCYEILFQRQAPCPGCQRGSNFRMESQGPDIQTYEVFSQSLTLDSGEPAVFVNLYHDITKQLKMERQIMESTKLAELGTIGSSIAHELNNPLGGILSFTQLIKMDMAPDHPLYPDIVEMEAGVQRCKEIVQNLLGFTRNPNIDQEDDINLWEVMQRALKIVELQTKSLGVEVKLHAPAQDVFIRGHFNLLAQAIKNILQNSMDHIIDQSRQQKGFRGVLDIRLIHTEEAAHFSIHDNGSVEKNSSVPIGLDVPVAQQILRDHKAELKFLAPSPTGNLAKISFSRLVLRS